MLDELSQGLLDFIRASIPTFQAARLLVLIVANPAREFTADDIVLSMRESIIPVSAVREYLALFVECGLLTEANGRFKYGPSSRELEDGVSRLVIAYNERPVSLITAIYRIADEKVQAASGRDVR